LSGASGDFTGKVIATEGEFNKCIIKEDCGIDRAEINSYLRFNANYDDNIGINNQMILTKTGIRYYNTQNSYYELFT
jgi:hypothetical protein